MLHLRKMGKTTGVVVGWVVGAGVGTVVDVELFAFIFVKG